MPIYRFRSLLYSFFVGAAWLLAVPAVRADVTLRYKTEVKLNPAFPPAIAQQAMKALDASLPRETVLQLKDGKGYTGFGDYRSIIDFTKQQMTLIDSEKQRYATLPYDQFTEEMAKSISDLPAEARTAMAAMKTNVESRVTGRTSQIQGLVAEEREVVLSIEGPPKPDAPSGPAITVTMQFWTVKDSEVIKVPALRELRGYNLWSYATMNPAGSIDKMFGQMPGVGAGMGKFVKEMQAINATVVRTHTQVSMPGLAAALKQMPAGQNPFGPDFDAGAPFLELNQEMAEISSAPVSDQVFQIPSGYKSATVGDLMRDMIARRQQAAKP